MKMILALFALLLAIIGGIAFFQSDLKKNIPFLTKTPMATINNHKFSLLIAKTPQEKEIGLSEKTSIPQDSGMIFVFDTPDTYPFWMKNMKFPIDIIYINQNKIITIFENTKPLASPDETPQILRPDEPADKVLEINAGLSQKFGIKKGGEVKLENL
ncbi:MAG: DUF192 domain-containing protein [Candidatus Levyibacteriota bacterium]|nr:MAG: DUF192 domain-containing protein [Candidatus Levybacteria bacterium]